MVGDLLEGLGGLLGGGGEEEALAYINSLRPVDREILLQEAQAGDTAFERLATDPKMRGEQLSSIAALRSLADQGGMGIQDLASLREAQAQNAAQERAGRGAIMQGAAMRGMGGAGSTLAAQLANQQGAAQRNALAGTQAAGDAANRRIQALRDVGSQAGAVRGQDWTEGASRASAADAMARFNASQRLGAENAAWGQAFDRANAAASAATRAGQQRRNEYAGIGAGIGGVADTAVDWKKLFGGG